MTENDPQKWWMTKFQTQIVSQRKINDCYSFATVSIDRKWIGYAMIIYRFQVIHTSRDHSFAIFMLLEPYGVSSLPYIESKWNLHWLEAKPRTIWWKSLTGISQCKKNTETKKSTFFFFFHSKPMEESVILNVQYAG